MPIWAKNSNAKVDTGSHAQCRTEQRGIGVPQDLFKDMDRVKVVSVPSVPWTQIAMNRLAVSTLLVVCLSLVEPSHSTKPPHILLIVADDLGWRDVGFHGSLINTPNLDQLSGDGLTLDNYYVQPICTPTRSALMTGKYPIHTGLQHLVVFPTQPYGLSPNETILPKRLKQAGYQTHMVGKWHLGYFADPYLPTRRGFDSFFGFYNGWEDHLTHKVARITDFRDGDEIAKDYEGAYSTVVFAKVSKNPGKDLDSLLAAVLVVATPCAPPQVLRPLKRLRRD